MSYKTYYLGILSAVMITSLSVNATDRGARFKQMEKAPQMAQQLHAGGAMVGAADAILGGAGTTNARAAHIQALLQPGADLTAGIGAVNALLGAGGGAADAHGKITHIQGELQPATNLTAGIGAVNALLGAGGGAADAHGKATHIIGTQLAGIGGAGNIDAKLAEILRRLNLATHSAIGGAGVAAPAAADIHTALTRAGL